LAESLLFHNENGMKYTGQIEFTLVEQGQERVVAEMPVLPGILNPFGIANAGAIVWFADVAASVLAFGGSDFDANRQSFPLAINLNANFLCNQPDGVFTATSEFVRRGKRLSVVRTTVTGTGGRLIADITTSHVPVQPAG